VLSLTYATVFACALVLALALTPIVRRVALVMGAVDQPGERKIHVQPVPRLGGAAVLTAAALVVAGSLVLNPAIRPAVASGLGALRWSVLALAALVVVTMAGLDDVRGLSARLKFVVELAAAAAVVLVAGAPRAIDLTPFADHVELGLVGPVLGVLWIVALTNAVNMTDVVDGVASGVSAIAAFALAMMSLAAGNLVATTVLLALSGALVGFLPHNLRTPKIFLGDTGSLGAGFILGAASLVGLQRDGAWLAVPAFLALAVPLGEFSLTILRRTLRAQVIVRATLPQERFQLETGSPGLFIADQQHVPHRLLELGLGKQAALTVLYAAGALLGAIGFAAVRWPWLGPFAGMVAAAGVVFFAPRWLYAELRLLERGALLPLLENRLVRSRIVHVVYDAVLVFVAFLIVEPLVDGWDLVAAGTAGLWVRGGVITVVALFGFWLGGLYRTSFRHAGISEALGAMRAVALGLVLAAGSITVLTGSAPSLSKWLLHLFLVLAAVVGARLSFRVLDQLYMQGRRAGQRVLIFGAGRGGDLAVREIHSNPLIDLQAIGFVDDDPAKWGRRFHGLTVHGADRLTTLIRELKVRDVVLTTRKLEPGRHSQLVRDCRQAGARLIYFDLQWSELGSGGVEVAPGERGLAFGFGVAPGSGPTDVPNQPLVEI
jgi:UDP-GlcNAc:undecaprenyl-phosphate GlcNAc-1-phosphate transferase